MSVAFTGFALPPEVWSHVLKQIPISNLPPLLGVCSLFHDITIRFLFSSVRIYFVGTTRGSKMLNTPHTAWVDETARKLMCKSWEILTHICQEPRFARIVKHITVVAFGDGAAYFEQLTVANTLLFIPNLQTFRWLGTGPDFGGHVAECLPATLKNLVMQSSLPLRSLQHLKQLESLHLSIPWFFPDDEEAHDAWTLDDELAELHPGLAPIDQVLDAISAPLKSLRITASQVAGIPIRILNNLFELEIIWAFGDETETIGLDLVFHHATQLRSLTLVGYLLTGLFSSLPPSSSGALPCLTSFRLSCDYDSLDMSLDSDVDFLIDFIRGRTKLRRLYIRIPQLMWSQTCDLWDAAKGLVGLEVLGLHAGRVYLLTSNLQTLVEHLPKSLRALHLAFDCDTSSLLPLVDALGKLPNLTFLHIYGTVSRLPVLLEDLANENLALQMIGLNRALWNIDRVGSDIITNKWPRWKIKFCIEEDFLCEDDAWLFKYN